MKILKSKRFLKFIQKEYGYASFEAVPTELILKDIHDRYRLKILGHKYHQVWPSVFSELKPFSFSSFKPVTQRRQINKDA